MFAGLSKAGASLRFPPRDSLASRLDAIIPNPIQPSLRVDRDLFQLFATASVEMWQRAVHSFLISASLTRASPIWSSVAGYYSSHYSIRALAHLLGYFQLRRRHLTVKLDVAAKQLVCHVSRGKTREHQFYWETVEAEPPFSGDPLFTPNKEETESDARHRIAANYFDHVDNYPQFEVLDEAYLKARIEHIAAIEVLDPPIPRASHFPDLENVQIVALHRLVRYRTFVDDSLGKSNRFWTSNRNPDWCPTYLPFNVNTSQALPEIEQSR
jgi:hypothetical protein